MQLQGLINNALTAVFLARTSIIAHETTTSHALFLHPEKTTKNISNQKNMWIELREEKLHAMIKEAVTA